MLKKIRRTAQQLIAPKNQKNVTMCKSCYSYYEKKAWSIERPVYLDAEQDMDVMVHFTKCPACIEQEVALYEMESDLVLGMRI